MPSYPPSPLPPPPQLKEMEGTLELVQNQRNELRQEVKDAKAALAEAERRMQVRTRGGTQAAGGGAQGQRLPLQIARALPRPRPC
jgi:hypothetical protein